MKERVRLVFIVVAASLAAITVAAYADVGHFGFVNYDDPPYVSRNAEVLRGLTTSGLVYAFTSFDVGNWHPLTWLSHMAVVELFGPAPAAHHLANLLLHVVNTVLLFAVLRGATGATFRSALVAALFALHPMHVESVAWISERKDVLSTTFWLGATGAYVASARGGGRAWLPVAALLLALGLMCKPMLVTLPFTLLLLDVWPLGRAPGSGGAAADERPWSRLLLEKLPLFALVAVASVITVVAQRAAGAVVPVGPETRLANSVLSLLGYLRKTVWPLDLAVFYPYVEHVAPLDVAAAAVTVAVLTAGAVACRRRAPAVTVGWLWFLGTLVPVIGLVQVGGQALADRYMYVPHIGLFIAVVFGGAVLLQRCPWRRGLGPAVAVAMLVPCFVLTRRQTATWSDDMALFGRAAAVTEGNYLAHEKLGGALYRSGQTEEAIAELEESIRIRPTYAVAYNNLGHIRFEQHRVAEAEAAFRAAIGFDPVLADARNNLGLALCLQGRMQDGQAEFEEALRLDPRHANAHNNLASALRHAGHLQPALDHYARALSLEPGQVQAARGIAWIRATSIDPALLDADEAVAMAERADAATQSQDATCRFTLAAAYARAGRFAEASRVGESALGLASVRGQAALASDIRNALARFAAGRPFEAAGPGP